MARPFSHVRSVKFVGYQRQKHGVKKTFWTSFGLTSFEEALLTSFGLMSFEETLWMSDYLLICWQVGA